MAPLAPVPALAARPPSLRAERSGHGAVLEYAGTRLRAWQTALAWLDRPVRHDDALAWLVVADDADLSVVRGRVQAAVGEGGVRAATGPPVIKGEDCAASFAEAHRLLRCKRGDVVGFDEAGLLQALLAVPPQRVAWFVDRHLGPILARPELIETLRVWLAARGSRRTASEQLHLHRNSVGYRVSQLKTRLGVDPLDPAHFAILQAALAAYDLLAADLH
jgi:hypothetical protein